MNHRILYVINNAAFFVSHRLPIALAAIERGDDVALATGQPSNSELEAAAIEVLARCAVPHRALVFTSTGINPLTELRGLWQLVNVMRSYKPTIVHCATPKGILYGGLAAWLASAPGLLLAISGQGYLYVKSDDRIRRLLRSIYVVLVRLVYRHANKRVIVQNRDDLSTIVAEGLASGDEVRLIPGSGVAVGEFAALRPQPRDHLVVLPARMLRDKGVYEFVGAATALRQEGIQWRFALVGMADPKNPASISEAQLLQWHRAGFVEWWGHRTDMMSVYERATIVCLPSYREGMPKALLEAAAAGCAVVTTDAVGCREAIRPGVSGELVPVRDEVALADALRRLINDPDKIRRYAEAGRELAAERFGVEAVVEQVLHIYDELGAAANAGKQEDDRR